MELSQLLTISQAAPYQEFAYGRPASRICRYQNSADASPASHDTAMFVSYPQYELPYPLLFEEPGAQYWRVMALNHHTPWFLLSVEHVAPDEPDMTFVRTLSIGWEYDLVETLRNLDPSRVKGLVCMLPAWQSDTGQWSAREIREVWLRGEHAVLVDPAGERLDANPILEPVGHAKMELLWRVASAR